MDLVQGMRSFVCAVEEGSLSAAARKLGLSPALTSKYLGELEARLGVRLMNRTTRALHLTDEGEAYFVRVKRILEDLDDLEAVVAARQSRPRGTLRVAGPEAFGVDCLSDAVADFVTHYPEVDIELDLHGRTVDLVSEGYDVAIRVSELKDSSFIARRVADYPYYVCASTKYLNERGAPEHPRDLAGHDCILTSPLSPTGQWQFMAEGKTIAQHVQARIRTNSARATAKWVRAGLGIGICLSSLVEEDLKAGRIKTVMEPYNAYHRSVWAVYPTSKHLSAKVRSFVDFLMEYFKDKR